MINKKVRWSGYLGTFHYALPRYAAKQTRQGNRGSARGLLGSREGESERVKGCVGVGTWKGQAEWESESERSGGRKGIRGRRDAIKEQEAREASGLSDTFKGCTCPIVDSRKAPDNGWWCNLKPLWRQRQAAARSEANSASITNMSILNRRKLCRVLQADLQRTQNPLWSCLSVILWGGFEWNLRGCTIPQEMCTLFLKIHSGSERQQLDAPGGCSSLDFKGQLSSAWQWPGSFPILCSQYASEGRAAREGLFQALSCSRHPTRCQSLWWFCAHGHLLPEPWAGACRLALHGCLVLIRQHLCLFFTNQARKILLEISVECRTLNIGL